MPRPAVDERQKLELQCRATISFNFGSICDDIDRFVRGGKISKDDGELLKRYVRNQGNDAIRVIENHLEYYKISRNHKKDQVNTHRVAEQAAKEG